MTDFTHSGYLELLRYLKEDLRYRVSSFAEFRDGDAVVLRHDIDFSVSKALEMARLDHEAGVTATFFVLTTAPFYNALAEETLVLLREIRDLGHEIGLHYDCSTFDGLSQAEMESRIRMLVTTLSTLLGSEITSIAQHKPATSRIRPVFPEYRDAYSREHIEEIAYVSDSRMRFGVPDVREFFRRNRRSQMLIHPIWWHREKLSRDEVLAAFKTSISSELHAYVDEFAAGIAAREK